MIFYFDENLPPQIARALNILDSKNKIYSVKDKFEGVKDLELIPKLTEEEAILITFDKNMRKIQAERKALKSNKMIVFFLAIKLNYWDTVKLFIKIWDKILSNAKKISREKEAIFFRITGQGKIEKF